MDVTQVLISTSNYHELGHLYLHGGEIRAENVIEDRRDCRPIQRQQGSGKCCPMAR